MVSGIQDKHDYPQERAGQDSYTKYHGRKVVLIVDARNYIGDAANESMRLEAKIVSENKKNVELEDVEIYYCPNVEEKYQQGTLRKKYIIGVFEKTEENE